MEFMSFTHYFCLIIIVFSQNVTLQSSEQEVEENEIASNSLEEKSQSKENSKEPLQEELPGAVKPKYTPATFHWQSGIVPYVIGKEYDAIIRLRIRNAMTKIEKYSCVVFQDMNQEPPQNQPSPITWLSITNPESVRECTHTTMSEEGVHAFTKAVLIIGYDCMSQPDIKHALLHALGFWDEVTHPQRNQYIRVMWGNIQPGYRKLFWRQTGEPPHKIVEYDPMSIMHFHDRAYSVNGAPTVLPVVSGLRISPLPSLSQIDVMKLRLAFGHQCSNRKVGQLLLTCQDALNDDEEQHTEGGEEDQPENTDPDDEEQHTEGGEEDQPENTNPDDEDQHTEGGEEDQPENTNPDDEDQHIAEEGNEDRSNYHPIKIKNPGDDMPGEGNPGDEDQYIPGLIKEDNPKYKRPIKKINPGAEKLHILYGGEEPRGNRSRYRRKFFTN